MAMVTTGLDTFLTNPPADLAGTRLGLLTNPSGINAAFESTIDLLHASADHQVVALFGPEHGVRGEAQAGEHVAGGVDLVSGLPVHSLYGATRVPSAGMLEGIDAIVADVQDIGVRYTTYISTIAHVITACAEHGVRVVILDRPNPLGDRVAGGLLNPDFSSFVGIHTIPVLHGLTIGEFGQLWAADHSLPEPTVIPMRGWDRGRDYDATGLPWVFPSPNLPTLDSVRVYPATCLFEGTTLSEGRGTTRPFEIIGAPWIVPERLVERLRARHLPGVAFRPLYFTPTFSKHTGTRCGGVQCYVTDPNSFDPIALGVRMLHDVRALNPDEFAWLPPRDGRYFIDILAGGDDLRTTLDNGSPIEPLLDRWRTEAAAFAERRAPLLLY